MLRLKPQQICQLSEKNRKPRAKALHGCSTYRHIEALQVWTADKENRAPLYSCVAPCCGPNPVITGPLDLTSDTVGLSPAKYDNCTLCFLVNFKAFIACLLLIAVIWCHNYCYFSLSHGFSFKHFPVLRSRQLHTPPLLQLKQSQSAETTSERRRRIIFPHRMLKNTGSFKSAVHPEDKLCFLCKPRRRPFFGGRLAFCGQCGSVFTRRCGCASWKV